MIMHIMHIQAAIYRAYNDTPGIWRAFDECLKNNFGPISKFWSTCIVKKGWVVGKVGWGIGWVDAEGRIGEKQAGQHCHHCAHPESWFLVQVDNYQQVIIGSDYSNHRPPLRLENVPNLPKKCTQSNQIYLMSPRSCQKVYIVIIAWL